VLFLLGVSDTFIKKTMRLGKSSGNVFSEEPVGEGEAEGVGVCERERDFKKLLIDLHCTRNVQKSPWGERKRERECVYM
jgi:hypothetical protein